MFNLVQFGNKSFKQSLLWICISILIFFLGLFYYESTRESRIYQELYHAISKASINSTNTLLADINLHKKNIQLLSELPSIQNYLHHKDSSDMKAQTTLRKNISSAFQALLKQETNIRQARLISSNGDEYVRVDRGTNHIVITPDNLLQSKANRGYFKTGMLLNNNEAYVSEITPNYEYGEIEFPLWPTYRVIKALKNAHDENIGLLILNIDASNSLNKLNHTLLVSIDPFQFDYYLVNHNGFYVAAPDKSLLFGDDLGNTKINWFTHTDNNVSLSSSEHFRTIFQNQSYLFSSQELFFSNNQQSTPYYLMAALPINQLEALIEAQRKDLFFSFFGFSAIVSLVIFLSLKHIRNLENLYVSQSRFKAIISNSSDAILSISREGNIQSLNYASSLLFGINEEQAIGYSFFNLVDESEEFNERYLTDILDSNSNKRIEIAFKNKFKQTRTLLLTLCPIQKKGDRNDSIALIIRDITFQKQNQKKLEAANQNLDLEVKKRTEQLEYEKQKAIKANDTKSMFVANISHEIRTPLNGISGLLSLARDKKNIEKQDDYLKMAQDSAQTLNILINDLLDLSKIESGKFELSPTPTNLKQLLETVISSVFFLIKNKNVELVLDCSKIEVDSLMLDENRLKQILTNLLSNAIKFTTEGEVTLTASTYSSDNSDKIECEFKVCDTGIGISHDQQTKLFKPFTQASSGISNKFGGTGLGLSISKQLCEIMGGAVHLDSKSGEGSTFKATLLASKLNLSSTDGSDDHVKHLDHQKIAIFVCNTALRRALRNTLNSWKASAILISHIDELKHLLEEQTLNGIILDASLYTPALELALNTSDLDIAYLSKDNAIFDKLAHHQLVKRPVLPSFLAKALSNKHTPGNSQNNADIPVPKHAEPENHVNSTKADKKIFIVDDNEINKIVAQGILTPLGVDIETAHNGEDILKKLKALKPSKELPVILMDCQMPVMNGYEATRSIREGKAGDWLKPVPIIALTADAMEQNIEECKAAGMNDFLGKPFDPEALKERVAYWANKNKV